MTLNKKLGDYELLELIGKGGQGEVYKALDTKLKRIVAIKVFKAKDENRRGKLAGFKYEARLASSLIHPNICAVYALFEDEKNTYILMEYIEGKNLFEIAYGHPLKIKSCLEIIIQVTEALVAAHSQGIIHRDIKPRNVMVTPQGRAVILDFGLAKLLEDDDGIFDSEASELFYEDIAEDLFVTVEGLPYGTPASSPPEMAHGNQTDARGDVYSVGVVLYLMLTGTYPFLADTVRKVRQKVINEEPVPVEIARKAGNPIPPELIKIVHRALQKKPDKRFQKMSEMRDELVAVLKNLDETEKETDLPQFPVFPEPVVPLYAKLPAKPFWKNPKVMLPIGGFLILIVFLFWYIFL